MSAPNANRLIAEVVTESSPDAGIRVQRLVLTPDGRRGITVGGGVLPNGDIALAIPRASRPYGDCPDVLDYYDGPLLVRLASPLWGDVIAMALPDEEGPWPFLLAPITAEQLESVKQHLSESTGTLSGTGRGLREHFTTANAVYLLRDYGAQDLVACPVRHPLPDAWLPMPGY